MPRSAYVSMVYEDHQGRHEVGEEVTFADETPQQIASFERLVAFGIISLEPPAEPAPEPESEPPQLPASTQQRRPRRRS